MKIIDIDQPGEHEVMLEKAGDYLVRLLVKQAHVKITGRWQVNPRSQLDVSVIVQHMVGENSATVSLKAVAQYRSKIKISGKIITESGCSEAKSFFSARVLAVSKTVQAELHPELEINHNDVQCSHATSISSIDDKQLFYLLSRGLSRQAARQLIISGYLA